MQQKKTLLGGISSFAVVLAGMYMFRPCQISHAAEADNAATGHVIYLDQGWSKADRDTYYWIPQGTVMMSFDIFENLELPDTQELFRSDANLERYGFIASAREAGNPDGLPIGITKHREYPLPHPPERAYKAAPRDGIWAEPPYLHNGSVPNLYELLIPAKERTKKFYVGADFDPVKVGIDTSGNSGKFLLDTTLEGNSNAGHSFENGPLGNGIIGPLLTEDERWSLVEYLKSIPEEPGRVTPFGGPPEAKSGHVKWEGPK